MKTTINHLVPARRAAVILAMSLLCAGAFAQPYNYRYPQTAGLSIQSPQGKSIARLGWCHVASANSIASGDGSTDFHLTFTSLTGVLISSFRIGNPGTNETCNAICSSTAAANTYLLCGSSHNGNMLVVRADATGTVTWSREIVFGGGSSGATTIVPITDPSNPGYIVVGNRGSEVAAARIDESGSVLWAHTYPMAATYLGNYVSDAIVHRALGAEKMLCITGDHITNTGQDIFRLNLLTTTGLPIWQQSIYSNSVNHVFGAPQVTNVGVGINTNDFRVIISFLQADSPLSGGFTDLNMLATDLSAPSTITWAHTYEKAGGTITTLDNNDLCRLRDGTFSALGTENTLPMNFNPVILNVDDAGNFNYGISINEGRMQFAHSLHLIENCGAGTEVFNAADANATPSTDLQVVANDVTQPDCTTPYPWPHIPADIVQTFVNLNPIAGAVAANYPMVSSNAGLANVFDCTDNPVFFKNGEADAQDEEFTHASVYPNPANTHITLSAGSTPETVTILNSLGQPVYSQTVQGTTVLDLTTLPAGYYTITHTTAQGEVRQEKLVIRH